MKRQYKIFYVKCNANYFKQKIITSVIEKYIKVVFDKLFMIIE